MTLIGGTNSTVPTAALPGVVAGTALTAGIAATTIKGTLSFPLPVGLAAGAMIGGPVAAISLMNHRGETNSLLQSALVGSAPLAIAGAALGAFGASWSSGATKGAIALAAFSGAATFGAVGAGIGAIAHGLTKPD